MPVSFLIKLQAEACNFITKETPAQVFSYNFAKFLRTPPVAASVLKEVLICWKKVFILLGIVSEFRIFTLKSSENCRF